ncbi:Saccharopine dehydrogenase-domain-containing protein [Pelagophyceae sp. CCMP2097]|nr:Saccharopine dehydrogenase-domain-containing protein [Pelagophyceae sp. CCMP2097]
MTRVCAALVGVCAVACGALAPLPRILVIGGTGRIGTAVASHLAARASVEVLLAGRDAKRGEKAVDEVRSEQRGDSESCVDYVCLDWRDEGALSKALAGVAAVVHTAGPYTGAPDVLQAAIRAKVPVYIDLSDPIAYLRAATALGPLAEQSGTLALVAGGAFPGMTNVLAMECAHRLGRPVHDLTFSYFTAGLGGSGVVNLEITNEGFGQPVNRYFNGKAVAPVDAGGGSRKVEFFLEGNEPSKALVGTRNVWNWPFPEALTVAEELKVSGKSTVGMGTAPDVWNVVMSGMTAVVPRGWWLKKPFYNGLAIFSRPLVAATDAFVGETHAMRIDVSSDCGRRVSAVQAHASFRRCVGQSCAEFTLALLESKGLVTVPDGIGRPAAAQAALFKSGLHKSGVFLPEALFSGAEARKPMLQRLLGTQGTLNSGFEGAEGASISAP